MNQITQEAGSVQQPKKTDKENAIELCKKACIDAGEKGEDFSNGPCLLNPIPKQADWVCDIAHSPRQDVDNLPENQCSAFRDGTANHFVELDEYCEIINVY